MENYWVIIFFVIAFVINVSRNYQKEQEKAKRRMSQQRPVRSKSSPLPQSQPELKPAPPIVEKSVYTKLEKTALIEESMPEEVLALKRSRELKEKEKAIKLHKAQQAQKETVEKEKIFDLRTAIIQSAILERPYQ